MIKENEIIVIDDIIDEEYQESIKDILVGNTTYISPIATDKENPHIRFPWYYTTDVTVGDDPESNQGRAGLSHTYVVSDLDEDGEEYETYENIPGIPISEFHWLFIPLLEKVIEGTLGLKTANVCRGRSFLQFPLNLNTNEPDTPHVDMHRNHFVILYYVVDSEGDTIIYNERWNNDIKPKKYTEKQRVTPKQGRVVIFDGRLYHTAEQSINTTRCIVNYDVAWEKNS